MGHPKRPNKHGNNSGITHCLMRKKQCKEERCGKEILGRAVLEKRKHTKKSNYNHEEAPSPSKLAAAGLNGWCGRGMFKMVGGVGVEGRG